MRASLRQGPPREPRHRLWLIPLLLIASVLATAWLGISQIQQLRAGEQDAARQRVTMWAQASQRALEGQLREHGDWQEATEEFLRLPAPNPEWLDYMYGPEFSINTGIHLVGAIRGNGKAAVWQERRPGLESDDWQGAQPLAWRRAMAPLIEKARQTPTRSVIAWMVLNGRAWLVGVHGLYADEDALPSREEQGMLVFGVPMRPELLSESSASLGVERLEVVSQSRQMSGEAALVCSDLPAMKRFDEHAAMACWQDADDVTAMLRQLGAPLGALSLVIVLASIATGGMLWRDQRRRRDWAAQGLQREAQLEQHLALNERFLALPHEAHNPQHALATLSGYLRRVREMTGAEVIIYRREVGNPNAGYLIVESRDEREWLSSVSLRRDPLWRLPAGRIVANRATNVDASTEESAQLLCQRLGATQLLGYSVSPHPGRSELLLVASRGQALEESLMMPVLDRTLNALIIRGLEQERLLLQQQVLQERETDTDTGLLSREGMLRLIKLRIDQLGRVSGLDGFVLMALRIGGLQELYEHAGPEAGNRQLELLQRRLDPLLGTAGHVARLETDRLLIMVPRRLLEAARGGICGWLDMLLVAVRHKVSLNGEDIYLLPSLGISRFPEDGEQMDALVYRCERALHDTLQLNREWHFFDEEAEREVRRLKQLEAEFVEGLQQDQLRLHLQPIVDGRDGSLVLSEALVRWQHPEHGLLGSGDFMPIIESANLDVALGRWVIKESIATLIRVHDAGHALHLSVNVTVRHMMDERFLADLKRLFQRPELCRQLTIELVESQLPEDIQSLAILFQRIRSQGVALALDDFGTGYSSLSQLQQLPFDKVKIDRQFVVAMDTDKGRAMIDAMLGLGEAFHLAVVAEGIETPEQRTALLARGCHLHQGYLYSRPLPSEQLIQHLKAGKHWLPASVTGEMG